MVRDLFVLTLLALATALLFAFNLNNHQKAHGEKKYNGVVKCGPDWATLSLLMEETSIPPIEGAGNHKFPISTKNDSAQFYFNQGMNMYYSFHIIEAMASFKKAAMMDPNAAMIQWAQGLAYGPNINDMGYSASPEALVVTKKAVDLSNNSTEKEQMLIAAMQARYTDDTTQSREHLNQLYTDKMQAAYEKFPNDPDVAALYADALMLQHPWDLWNIDGTPKPWTPQIRKVLENLLEKSPNHPGANHYYIHVMEPSPYAEKALPSADRLGNITPGLSHTVHMPSHIYLRTGHYEKGVRVNEDAVNSYRKMIQLYAPVTGNDFLYIIHNLHMKANNAMLAGSMHNSIKSAMETVNSIPADYLTLPGSLGSYIQYISMTDLLTDVRFARWEQLIKRTKPGSQQVYANVLYHFGKGMAFSHLSKLFEARNELAELRNWMKDSVLLIPFTPFSPAIKGATVAEKLLEGTILLKEKKYEEALTSLRIAVTTEQNMVYTEPRDWLLNPKHYLGNALLIAGKNTEAEKVFRKDLENNKENAWALIGLYQSLLKQKKEGAQEILNRFRKAGSQSDVKIKAAVL